MNCQINRKNIFGFYSSLMQEGAKNICAVRQERRQWKYSSKMVFPFQGWHFNINYASRSSDYSYRLNVLIRDDPCLITRELPDICFDRQSSKIRCIGTFCLITTKINVLPAALISRPVIPLLVNNINRYCSTFNHSRQCRASGGFRKASSTTN